MNATENLKKVNIRVFNLELQSLLYFSNPYYQPVLVDTPCDFLRESCNDFSRRLVNSKFEVLDNTYRLIEELHDTSFKDEPPLMPNSLSTDISSYVFKLFAYNFLEIKSRYESAALFLGRSTKLLLAYLWLNESLKNIDVYWLYSRNESRGGLGEYTTESGISELRRKLGKYEAFIVIDDVSITNKTLIELHSSLNPKNIVFGITLVNNLPTSIYSREIVLKNVDDKTREEILHYHERYYKKILPFSKTKPKNLIIIGALSTIAPYANTLSHVTGDSIEKFLLIYNSLNKKNKLYEKTEELANGLMRNFSIPLEDIMQRLKQKGYIKAVPTTR